MRLGLARLFRNQSSAEVVLALPLQSWACICSCLGYVGQGRWQQLLCNSAVADQGHSCNAKLVQLG